MLSASEPEVEVVEGNMTPCPTVHASHVSPNVNMPFIFNMTLRCWSPECEAVKSHSQNNQVDSFILWLLPDIAMQWVYTMRHFFFLSFRLGVWWLILRQPWHFRLLPAYASLHFSFRHQWLDLWCHMRPFRQCSHWLWFFRGALALKQVERWGGKKILALYLDILFMGSLFFSPHVNIFFFFVRVKHNHYCDKCYQVLPANEANNEPNSSVEPIWKHFTFINGQMQLFC